LNRPAFIVFALLSFVLSSCGTLKNSLNAVIPNQPLATDLESFRKIMDTHSANYTWLTIDGEVDYDDGSSEITAGISIRNRKDSIIWASANKMIEAARILINKDSAMVLNRLQRNYSVVSVVDFDKMLGLPNLNFQSVQNLLTAKPPFGIDNNSRFQVLKEFYRIENQTSVYKEIIEVDKSTLRVLQYKYEKNAHDYVLVKYSNFKENKGEYLPNLIDIEIHSPDKIHITLNVSGYGLPKNADVPFEIPASYTKAQ